MKSHTGARGRGIRDWSIYGAVSLITEAILNAPEDDFHPLTLTGNSPMLPDHGHGYMWNYNDLPNKTSVIFGGRTAHRNVSGSFVLTDNATRPRGVGTIVFIYLPVNPIRFWFYRTLDWFTPHDPFISRYFREIITKRKDEVRAVLHHELVHMFDLHEEPVQGSKRMGKGSPDDAEITWENYFGTPTERNAYTGMWGCNMRRVMDMALQHDCPNEAYLTLLRNGFNPTSFTDTLTDDSHSVNGAQREFFRLLRNHPRARRQFYGRLYGVWAHAVDTLRKKFPDIV